MSETRQEAAAGPISVGEDYPPTPGTGEELLVSHEEWLAPLKGALNALAASAPVVEAEEET